MFGIELKQLGDTIVNSDIWRMTDGEWINLFFTDLKVINGALEIVSIEDVLGEYKDKGWWCVIVITRCNSETHIQW